VRRNNTLKAAGTLALAAAFLVPVGATYANWRDVAPVGSDAGPVTIEVGHLFLNDPSARWGIRNDVDGTWIKENQALPVSGGISPGQTLVATADLTSDFAGTGIEANFEIECNLPSLPTQLPPTGSSITVKVDGRTVCGDFGVVAGDEHIWTFLNDGKFTDDVRITVPRPRTITLEFSIQKGAQLASSPGQTSWTSPPINLGGFNVTLTQVVS